MSYLTLEEAAQYVNNRKSPGKITPANLLRAGVHGLLLICAPFGFEVMYCPTTKKNEEISPTLLVLPPTHLLEIETNGEATIQVAFSLDGKTTYSPGNKGMNFKRHI